MTPVMRRRRISRPASQPASQSVGRAGMKIIHVDDNKYALDDIRKDIPQIVPGAELHSFDHPDPALAFAGTEGCDVLMTEVELWSERLADIRLAKAMKKINPRINIIFLTVYSEKEVARELSDLQISAFIPKPWKLEELVAAFQNLR